MCNMWDAESRDPEHYKKFWDVDPTLPYVWPNGAGI